MMSLQILLYFNICMHILLINVFSTYKVLLWFYNLLTQKSKFCLSVIWKHAFLQNCVTNILDFSLFLHECFLRYRKFLYFATETIFLYFFSIIVFSRINIFYFLFLIYGNWIWRTWKFKFNMCKVVIRMMINRDFTIKFEMICIFIYV